MGEEKGLFAWIRKTSFLTFVLLWVIGIFIFTFVYWFLSLLGPGINTLMVDNSSILFNFNGLVESLYISLLTATIFGVVKIIATGLFRIFVYVQLAFSGLVILTLIDKLLQKYVFPHYHVRHTQDKKITTMMLTMSIFREDIDRIKSEFKSKSNRHINFKEIEATIDGLYVVFLDIDKMFSVRNMHKHDITDKQHTMVIINIEDSLHKLSKFIDFLNDHKVEWKDKSVEFWLKYILETADKIMLHFDDVKIRNPKLIIAIENIKELTEEIEKKI